MKPGFPPFYITQKVICIEEDEVACSSWCTPEGESSTGPSAREICVVTNVFYDYSDEEWCINLETYGDTYDESFFAFLFQAALESERKEEVLKVREWIKRYYGIFE